MIVVADASPLVALVICDSLDILDKLFDEVKVSQDVYHEVIVDGKFGAAQLKEYLQEKVIDLDLNSFVIEGSSLDKGELSSIALYKHLQADCPYNLTILGNHKGLPLPFHRTFVGAIPCGCPFLCDWATIKDCPY